MQSGSGSETEYLGLHGGLSRICLEMGQSARRASLELQDLSTAAKNRWLLACAKALRESTSEIHTPIHREVGGDNCEYFPLHDGAALAACIRRWESESSGSNSQTNCAGVPNQHDGMNQQECEGDSDVVREVNRFVPMTWKASAEQLLDELLTAYDQYQRRGRK
jgi:hypothetical protein